jgi:hypothetical protein
LENNPYWQITLSQDYLFIYVSLFGQSPWGFRIMGALESGYCWVIPSLKNKKSQNWYENAVSEALMNNLSSAAN